MTLVHNTEYQPQNLSFPSMPSKIASDITTKSVPITITLSGAHLPPLLFSWSKLTEPRGEHIHHGYFMEPTDSKERAQLRLIELLLEKSALPAGSTVLDVGCGIGGTSRYLAEMHGCKVTGITISGRQVEIAQKITSEVAKGIDVEKCSDFAKLGVGQVRFLELDAEKMGDYFTSESNNATFDCVWISEAMSHLPDKELFFRNAALLLNPGGKLVIADWFKAEGLTSKQVDDDIKPIEGV